MAQDFVLISEVALDSFLVTRKVVTSLAVADQDWLTDLHRFTLALEAVIGVDCVNNPGSIIFLMGVHTCFLLSGCGRVHLGSERHAVYP